MPCLVQAKPTLLYFSSATCKPCVKLNAMIQANGVLGDFVTEHFNFIDLTPPSSLKDSLMERFGVTFSPQMIFIDSNGTELNRFYGTPKEKILRWQFNRVLSGYHLPILEQKLKLDSNLNNWSQWIIVKLDQGWFDTDLALKWYGSVDTNQLSNPDLAHLAYRLLNDSDGNWTIPFHHPMVQYLWNNYSELKDLFNEGSLCHKLMACYKDFMFESIEDLDFSVKPYLDIPYPKNCGREHYFIIEGPDQIARSFSLGFFVREEIYTKYYELSGDSIKLDSMLNLVAQKLSQNREIVSHKYLNYFWRLPFSTKLKPVIFQALRERYLDKMDPEVAWSYFEILLLKEDYKLAKQVYREVKPKAKSSLEGEKLLLAMKRKLKKAKKQ